MKRHFEKLTERAGRAVKHWWLMMLAGLLCFAAGICVFVFPLESYVVLCILTGIMMLVSGAAQLIIASSSGNYLTMRGYMIAGGVIDLILGIMMCAWPGVTLAVIPIMLGIWMMYHAFMLIAFGGDLDTFRIKGGSWAVLGGMLLLILSFIVLVNPFRAGISVVIAFAGVGLLVLGLLICWMSFVLRDIYRTYEKEYASGR